MSTGPQHLHADCRRVADLLALRNLERDGILTRTVYPTIPPRVEYELSDRGRSLKVALAPIGNWVRENQTSIEKARERFRKRSAQGER